MKFFKKTTKDWKICGGIFDIDKKKSRIQELEKSSNDPDFWQNNEKAQNILKELNELKEIVDAWDGSYDQNNDSLTMLKMAEEENDENVLPELKKEADTVRKVIDKLELQRMLGGVDDKKNAICTIHSGAGGTESQDWADMLFRMYTRYAQRHNFKVDILDHQAGEEAGLKSVTIEISGPYAYGYLKAEAGVHRLVRISPYDANSRRHTSFASVFVYPEVEEDIEITINPADLRIDTYRASGAGGQHVNKTSSAVRITHLPTNIVVQCQNERSQFQNKTNAMKILASRIYQQEKEEERKKLQAMENEKKDIAWGSQIRSYVFQPYTMVKDHRTTTETSDVQAVMDGEIDNFITSYLLEFSN